MILASAQTQPTRWNIEKNLSDHYQLIELASVKGANLIAFPELSITGYEREGVDKLAFQPGDKRLDKLRELAASKNIIIIAGAPVKLDEGLYIGSFVLYPDGNLSYYTKHFLHPGEEEYFASTCDHNPLIEIKNERIALAICADIDHPEHPAEAAKNKTSVYIPSIFFSPGGLPGAYKDLSGYAAKYSMSVLMSNFCKTAWGRSSGGGSAFWDNKGTLLGNLNDSDPGLLLAQRINGSWKAEGFYI